MMDGMSDGIEVSLLADGLLWMINRTVFHPRGFALGYDPDTKVLRLYGDGTEAWMYALDQEAEDVKFHAFEDLLERKRAK